MTRTPRSYAEPMLGLLRIVSGLLFLEHGLNKIIGWPPGMPGHQALFSLFGAAGVVEIVCGVLLILGLFTRVAAFVAAGEMAFAYWTVHAMKGLYPSANGGDPAILYCFIFLYLVCAGSGAFALDRTMRRDRV